MRVGEVASWVGGRGRVRVWSAAGRRAGGYALVWGCASPQDGKAALLHAAEYGEVDIVRLLLDHGASVDDADYVSQPTHLAAPLSSLREASGSVPQRNGCGWARWPAGGVGVAAWL